MKSEIVAVGTELLLGNITDTNSSYLAAQLPLLGIDLYWVSQVGDNQPRIVEVLKRAWERSDLTLVTGGLGPTEDDITRESIAAMLGEQMTVDPSLEARLREFFGRRNMVMPERNVKQAALIPSARAIPNPQGTAPGWWVEKSGKVLACMPGVPREMHYMWENEVVPMLRQHVDGEVIHSRTFKTLGLSEALVDEMLTPLLHSTNPSIGVYAKDDGIWARLTAKAATADAARELMAPVDARIRSILGTNIWGEDNDTLPGAIRDIFLKRGLTLATMESCSGGLLADSLTDAPGASRYYKGGLVAYTAEMKVSFGVDTALIETHGMISAECAQAMAQAARCRLGADIGVGLTGVAGPDPMEDKPVGTVYTCVVTPNGTRASHALWPRQRREVKRWAVLGALGLLRRAILDLP